jgi:hypothetical protein
VNAEQVIDGVGVFLAAEAIERDGAASSHAGGLALLDLVGDPADGLGDLGRGRPRFVFSEASRWR